MPSPRTSGECGEIIRQLITLQATGIFQIPSDLVKSVWKIIHVRSNTLSEHQINSRTPKFLKVPKTDSTDGNISCPQLLFARLQGDDAPLQFSCRTV